MTAFLLGKGALKPCGDGRLYDSQFGHLPQKLSTAESFLVCGERRRRRKREKEGGKKRGKLESGAETTRASTAGWSRVASLVVSSVSSVAWRRIVRHGFRFSSIAA